MYLRNYQYLQLVHSYLLNFCANFSALRLAMYITHSKRRSFPQVRYGSKPVELSRRHVITSILPDCVCLSIFTAWQRKKLFQFPLQCLKCRSFHFIFLPALKHYFIKCNGSTRWEWHAVAIFNLVKNLRIGHTCSTKTDLFRTSMYLCFCIALRWR